MESLVSCWFCLMFPRRIPPVEESAMSLLPIAREGNVFTGVCHSVHNRPYGYSITAHPCYGAVATHPTGMLSCCLEF